MLDAIRDLLSSKKFLMAVLGLVAGIAARFGFQMDPTATAAWLSPLLVAILGQGIADHGKGKFEAEESARSSWRKPEAGFARLALLIALTMFGLAVAMSSGCGALVSTGKAVARAGVDCTRGAAAAAAGELAPIVVGDVVQAGAGGHVDLHPLVAAGKSAGRKVTAEVTGCAMATAVDAIIRALAAEPKTFAQQFDPDELRAAFRRVADEDFGGATFHVEGGGEL